MHAEAAQQWQTPLSVFTLVQSLGAHAVQKPLVRVDDLFANVLEQMHPSQLRPNHCIGCTVMLEPHPFPSPSAGSHNRPPIRPPENLANWQIGLYGESPARLCACTDRDLQPGSVVDRNYRCWLEG
jgi:hypothetical protein